MLVCFLYRSPAEALPQAPAAPADLERDCDGPDGSGSAEGAPSALPQERRPSAPRHREEGAPAFDHTTEEHHSLQLLFQQQSSSTLKFEWSAVF